MPWFGSNRWYRHNIMPLLVLLLALAPIVCPSCLDSAPGANLTASERIADAKYLLETIRDNHPLLDVFARSGGEAWTEHEERFLRDVTSASSDAQFGAAVDRLLTQLRDPYMTVLSGPKLRTYQAYPHPYNTIALRTTPEIAAYWFELGAATSLRPGQSGPPFWAQRQGGSYYVIGVASPVVGAQLRIGDRLLRIGGQPVEAYQASPLNLAPRLAAYHRFPSQHLLLPMDPQGELDLEVAGTDGQLRSVTAPGSVVADNAFAGSPWARAGTTLRACRDDSSLYTALLSGGHVAYVSLRGRLGETDRNDLRQFFAANALTSRAVIIDIRGNRSLSNDCWFDGVVGQLGPGALGVDRLEHVYYAAYRSGDHVGQFVRHDSGHRTLIPKARIQALQASGALPELPPEVLTSAYTGLVEGRVAVSWAGSASFAGRIYLLVDEGTAAGAEAFASFAKSTGWATLVGTSTGGGITADAPHGAATPYARGWIAAIIVLPHSGMALTYPTVMELNADGSANAETCTTPDYVVEMDDAGLREWLKLLVAGDYARQVNLEADTVLRECLRMALDR